MRWSELVKENADDLAKIMTLESGKPLNESYGEVSYGASYIDFYAAEALRPTSAGGGLIIPTPFARAPVPVVAGENKQNVNVNNVARGTAMVIHQGVGVCGIISPWNFPFGELSLRVYTTRNDVSFILVFCINHITLAIIYHRYIVRNNAHTHLAQ